MQYKNRDNAKFVKHMENEHGAYFDLEFILATCFMDEDEKKAVKSVIETKNVDDLCFKFNFFDTSTHFLSTTAVNKKFVKGNA